MKTYSVLKLVLVLVILVLSLQTCAIGLFWLYSEYEEFRTESARLESGILSEKKEMVRGVVNGTFDYIAYRRGQTMSYLRKSLKERVYGAHSSALDIYTKNKKLKTTAEIRKVIIEGMRPIRFSNSRGYFFAGNILGIEQLFADRPEMEGMNLYDMRDTKGAYVIRDMISLVSEKGEGFYTYYWTKPGAPGKNYPKIAFVKFFEPLRWFIGTGEYLDDFENEIKKEVLGRISSLRYGKNNEGCISLITYDGTMIINPVQPELTGKNRWELVDPEGVLVVQEKRKAALNPEGGFIYYKWHKPGTEKAIHRVSFVRGIDDWQWIIGAGTYLDEIDIKIMDKKKELRESIFKNVAKIFAVLLSTYSIAIAVYIFVSRRVQNYSGIFISFFKKSEKMNIPIDMEKIKFTEFRVLAESANRMAAEREKIQREMIEAKDRAIEANQAKNYFLASVSHEIRTPMNAIMGMTDIVLQTPLDKEQREYLELVKISTDNLLNLINNILEFSKIESKKVPLESRTFNISSVLRQSIKLFENAAKEKGLELTVDINSNVPLYVKGDPRLLTQVLVNLVSNSLKFTETGGISVSVERIDQAGESSFVTLSFSVSDTGIGIPGEKLGIIFDCFRQADPTFTRKYGGAGLGLTISKELIELMGGFISVKSEPGKGSTFSFVLPFILIENGIAEPSRNGGQQIDLPSGPFAILVAEDNLVNARMAKIMLEKKGHRVTVASNGREAIETLKGADFDIILMDIEMPEIDGIEVTKLVRQGKAGECKKDIPIIAMSAHVLEDIKNECIRAGMNEFISKPVNITQISKIITATMAKNSN